MLKHGILGLLNYGPMTGYEINEVFRDSLSFFWKAQTSQIYRELQKLKSLGWALDVSVRQEGKPDKNVFTITDVGKEELIRWLSEEDMGFENRIPLLMKTFFRGEIDKEKNIEFFRKVAFCCDYSIPMMKVAKDNILRYKQKLEDTGRELYWEMTTEYGVMYMNMLKEWSSYCLEKLQKGKGVNDESFDN